MELPASLGDLARQPEDLGSETANSGGKELASTPVFARQIQRAAEAMKQAANAIKRCTRTSSNGEPPAPADVTRRGGRRGLQKEALRRIDQLLDALKTETDALAKRNSSGGEGPAGEGEPPRGGARSGLPPLGQLKLLRAMQTEVNQAIDAFRKKHPAA